MGLYFGHICVFLTLMLAACVPASADIVVVDSNDSDEYGDALGSASSQQSYAGASADGSTPYSWAYGTGSYDLYSTEQANFYCDCYVYAFARAWADWVEGSCPYGGANGGASSGSVGVGVYALAMPSTYGDDSDDDDGGYPGGDHDYYPVGLGAWECVSSSHGSCAEASAEAGSLNGSNCSMMAQTTLSLN
jgi:hypothetical protein